MLRSVRTLTVLLLLLQAAALPAEAGPPRVAVFDFSLVNTSPAPTTDAETARLRSLSDKLRQMLAASGRYAIADLAPMRDKLRDAQAIRDCNGCELALATEN